MPFCRNCGAEISEGGRFCTKCGTPMESQPTPAAPQPEPVVTPQQPMYGTPQQPQGAAQPMYGPGQNVEQPKPKKPFNVKLLIIIIAAALVVIGAIIAVVCVVKYQKSKIDVGKYVEVTFEGYDTAGRADVELDYSELIKKVVTVQGYDPDDSEEMTRLYNKKTYYNTLKDFYESIEIEVEPEEELSNGDEVVVTITYDKELMKKNKVRFTNCKLEYTVEGLEPIQDVNPFDDITVEFSGTAPDGYAYYNNNSSIDYVRYCSFSFDKSSGLKNGDVITLTVSEDDAEYALSNGYRFTETSKEYTVEGIAYYISTISDLSESDLTKLKEAAREEIIDDYGWKDYYATVSDISYVGAMLAIPKDSSYTQNVMVMVFSAKVSSTDGDFDPTDIYVPVEIDDIRYDNEGEFGYNSYLSTLGTIEVEDQYYTLIGYVDGKTLYDSVVVANEESYDWEFSEDLPDLSKEESKTDAGNKDDSKDETAEDETAEDETAEDETTEDETEEE